MSAARFASLRRLFRPQYASPLRVFERRLKASAFGALAALMGTRRPREAPRWTTRPHRILYLRYDRLGDMLLATGILRAIVRAQPTISIDVLASVANSHALRGNPCVGRVITLDKRHPWSYVRALARVRQVRYDAVVDAMVMAPSLTAMLLMWASGARHRIGLGDRGNDFVLTLPVARLPDAVHYVDHSAALLAAFGVNPLRLAEEAKGSDLVRHEDGAARHSQGGWGIWRPEIFLSAAELSDGEARWRAAEGGASAPSQSRRRLVVNVSAGSDWRYWPEECFISTLLQIRASFPELSILLVGAPPDEARMRRIGQGSSTAVTCTAEPRQMMAVVATCDFVFTADTSITHVASAFGKAAVVMFARSMGALYGPYGTRGRIVSTPAPSLATLRVEPVVQALTALLSEETRAPAFEPIPDTPETMVHHSLSAGTLAGRGRQLSPAAPPGT